MSGTIMKYLIDEKAMKPVVAERNLKKVTRYEDIAQEFEEWIKTRKYKGEGALRVEGYTAADICRMAPFMDGLGVFNFLVTLRDQPEKAKQYIAQGFPMK